MGVGNAAVLNTIPIVSYTLREATKKNRKKKFTTVVNYGGGQQTLVCEPQKSAFFRANFPKKNMLKLIHNVPFVYLYKIQSLNSFKIPDAGFHLYILPFKIM